MFLSIVNPPSMHQVYAFLKVVVEQILPDTIDAIIFLDTDVLVLRDISELWDEFEQFSDKQCLGVVEEQSGMSS